MTLKSYDDGYIVLDSGSYTYEDYCWECDLAGCDNQLWETNFVYNDDELKELGWIVHEIDWETKFHFCCQKHYDEWLAKNIVEK